MWADVRPNDHDNPAGLSRVPPCNRCGHDEHLYACGVVIAERANEGRDVLCPCRGGIPIPGVFTNPRNRGA